jgi:RNA 3'-terminal phosphate cyclase (ATP)
MIKIDGSQGEGGGQVIRTALALSLFTGKPFVVENVRAGRQKPGLQNQHLTCVKAAARIGNASVDGARLGGRDFSFVPQTVQAGRYTFSIGTAGSTMLVLQTILPPLMVANADSQLTLEGGTHNQHAPPFDFIAQTFLPLLNKMGADVIITLEKYGFYPPGGGKVNVVIRPNADLKPITLAERGQTSISARSLVVKLPRTVAERELRVIERMIPKAVNRTDIDESSNALSPGNVVVISAASSQLLETITAIGERRLPAEAVAKLACDEANQYLSEDVPVGIHLADQLLIPLAMAGSGSYLTLSPSLHTTTNIQIVQKFLNVDIAVERVSSTVSRIAVRTKRCHQ